MPLSHQMNAAGYHFHYHYQHSTAVLPTWFSIRPTGMPRCACSRRPNIQHTAEKPPIFLGAGTNQPLPVVACSVGPVGSDTDCCWMTHKRLERLTTSLRLTPMLLCPVHSQTSPNRTSSNTILCLELVKVRLPVSNAGPAFCGGIQWLAHRALGTPQWLSSSGGCPEHHWCSVNIITILRRAKHATIF